MYVYIQCLIDSLSKFGFDTFFNHNQTVNLIARVAQHQLFPLLEFLIQ